MNGPCCSTKKNTRWRFLSHFNWIREILLLCNFLCFWRFLYCVMHEKGGAVTKC